MNIKNILKEEENALKELLELLEAQFKFIMKKDIFALEEIVEKIKLSNKKVAEWEVERRKLVQGEGMKKYIKNLKDAEIEDIYSRIIKNIASLKTQKETNELLLRQGISFNQQILNIINPKREMKTYNSYGALRR